MSDLEANLRREPSPEHISRLNTDQEWRDAAKVLQVLRPSLHIDQFVGRRPQLVDEGYHLLGVKVDHQIVSIASYTVSPHAVLGRELLIHDMATLPSHQGCGHASALLTELAQIAKDCGCGRLFVHTRDAQSLYSQNGFDDYSTGMIKKLSE